MWNKSISYMASVAIQTTIRAAIASYELIGKNDAYMADQVAVDAMRTSLNQHNIIGRICAGEGERDKAPMLYRGEIVGIQNTDSIHIDIALDPLEGTNLCANNIPGAISVMLVGSSNSIISMNDVYMEKIATRFAVPNGLLDLENDIHTNISNLADFLGKPKEQLSVTLLNRSRHLSIIDTLHDIGVRTILIEDGDVAGIIQTGHGNISDLYIGIGGAPEGILAAGVLHEMGGYMQCRAIYEDGSYDVKLTIDDMIFSEVIFCATGVTGHTVVDDNRAQSLVKGVKKIVVDKNEVFETETLLIHKGVSNIIQTTIPASF